MAVARLSAIIPAGGAYNSDRNINEDGFVIKKVLFPYRQQTQTNLKTNLWLTMSVPTPAYKKNTFQWRYLSSNVGSLCLMHSRWTSTAVIAVDKDQVFSCPDLRRIEDVGPEEMYLNDI